MKCEQKINKSISLSKNANNLLPGGVNSPVRSVIKYNNTYNSIFIESACDQHIIDVNNNKYIDYICSWGSSILGHNNKFINTNIKNALKKGISFGNTTKKELEYAQLIIDIYKSIDMIRMTNSGTEATLTAIRLARAYTKKKIIIKFDGCYHGFHDNVLVKPGSGNLTFETSVESNGILKEITQHTLVAKFNCINSVKNIFKKYKNEIACIIIEPIAANMNLILPKKNFLSEIEDICKNNNTLLIFDEVITGFRVNLGGAQNKYNINPDITCLGKIIGGGLPIGVVGGKKHIMQQLAPVGNVYHAGTLSGNLITTCAGIAAMSYCKNNPKIYKKLEKK